MMSEMQSLLKPTSSSSLLKCHFFIDLLLHLLLWSLVDDIGDIGTEDSPVSECDVHDHLAVP
jgi:hypothetical protein